MQTRVKLPIGIENFEEIRTEGYYYVDKTGLIRDIVNNGGKINLFTRPRRFGKSLNMSMLKYFFEYGCKKEIFESLEIAKETKVCEEYMGKFPVISVSLKGVDGRSYDVARSMLCSIIGREAMRFDFLRESNKLLEEEKDAYKRLLGDRKSDEDFKMLDATLMNSLLTLTKLLYKHYNQKAIVLIDEYDVPLDKAHQHGNYDEMLTLIRGLLGQVLKTNDSLQLAVLTGCLRISKESIFTGLNNFKVCSIKDVEFDEYFGFKEEEVAALLRYYGLEERHDVVKNWYNGYRFGKTDVYCPWDVINYVSQAMNDPDIRPRAYWINSSGNSILRTFLQSEDMDTMQDIEDLVNGEKVKKKIREELTYQDLYEKQSNIWSVLYTTGYLTSREVALDGDYYLVIPNFEIKQIFIEQIETWFDEEARRDSQTLETFCEAFPERKTEEIEEKLNDYLDMTIGIHDYSIRQELKENYYHGLLVGLLSNRKGWRVMSNIESGDGYADILIEIRKKKIGIVIETKCPKDGKLKEACMEGLRQIEENNYQARLLRDGMKEIIKYGVAFYRKECKVEGGSVCRQE